MAKYLKTQLLFLSLAVLLCIAAFANLHAGSIQLTGKELLQILFSSGEGTSMEYSIIWKIRLPRLLGAALFGGALSISGFLMQTFFQNPIAGPFVLGISSGAKLFVGLFLLAVLPISQSFVSPYTTFFAAFVGAMLSMLVVLLIAKKVENISMLLVIGMMIGYLCSAGTDFMVTFAQSAQIQNFTIWSMGSFSGITWEILRASALIILPAVAVTFLLTKPLNALLLGENYAKSMGVNVQLFRFLLILLSSILAACVTAFAGPISFLGIAVPHVARLLFRKSSAAVLLPASFLMGSCFSLFCDLLARTAFAPVELAISTVTSVFGAPIVIYLMIRRRKAG